MAGELHIATSRRDALVAYLDLLGRWSRVFNLTAIRDPGEMVVRHLLDSVSVLPWLRSGDLLDVGTGAGLPGLVLGLVQPERRCVLVDRAAKKIRFVRQAAAELGATNVEPLHVALQDHRTEARYATIVTRASLPLEVLWAESRTLLAPGGIVLAMKGRAPHAEVEPLTSCPSGVPAGSAPSGPYAEIVRVQVPGLPAERHLVILSPRVE